MDQSIKHLERKRFILFLGIMTLVFALAMPDRDQLFANYLKMIQTPAHLLADSFAIGGRAAAFFNAGLHFLLAYRLLTRYPKAPINGLQIGAVGIFVGHSFFGTDLFNVLPIMAGMVLYAKFTRQSFRLYTTVSFFATALAPVVSYLAFPPGWTLVNLLMAILVGLALGFIAPALAEEFLKFHHGLTLYNFGFTTGIIGMFLVLFLPYFGLEVAEQSQISQTAHRELLFYLLLVLGALLVALLRHSRAAVAGFLPLIRSTGRVPDDFVTKYGIMPTLLNMVLTGSTYLTLCLALGVTLNGPILGGLLTITGFSAFGKHLRNTLPISVGVLLAALLLGNPLGELRTVLALLFATGLAPIAGFYGLGYGLVAGFLHYNLALAVLPLHQGMSLYNNGFSTGFVAAFLSPIIDTIDDHKSHWLRKKKSNVIGKK